MAFSNVFSLANHVKITFLCPLYSQIAHKNAVLFVSYQEAIPFTI